jgi:hypothetical protein
VYRRDTPGEAENWGAQAKGEAEEEAEEKLDPEKSRLEKIEKPESGRMGTREKGAGKAREEAPGRRQR